MVWSRNVLTLIDELLQVTLQIFIFSSCQALLAWVHAEPTCAEAWQLAALTGVHTAACARGAAGAWQRAQRLCLQALQLSACQIGTHAGKHLFRASLLVSPVACMHSAGTCAMWIIHTLIHAR